MVLCVLCNPPLRASLVCRHKYWLCRAKLTVFDLSHHFSPACLPACLQCGLGDAFRCGGCPYRGLPSFEMGKKIELPSDFLAVDL